MELKRCSKGHFYDAEANSSCPQCAAEQAAASGAATMPGNGMQNYGKTEPMGYAGPGTPGTNLGATEPVDATTWGTQDFRSGTPGTDLGATEPVDATTWGTQDFRSDTPPVSPGSSVEDYESITQPVNFTNEPAGFYPVVGWLVSIEGPSKGTDYRFRAGYNYIGRDDYMDICIKGDNQISRNKHAVIAYDPVENIYFFGPADGKSLVRVNGKVVLGAQEIHTYDTLTLGSTKLRFVALCNEEFKW